MMIGNSLKSFNTFGIDQSCLEFKLANNRQLLIAMALACHQQSQPMLIIGGGSNLVLLDDFLGCVIKVDSQGLKVSEDQDWYYLDVEAGVNWHALIEQTLALNMPGLENMALIPGCVGAAPIQNIGAYGKEFCDVCAWVEYLDLTSGEIVRLTAEQCGFDYRESVFKHELQQTAVILSVGIKLAKSWTPLLNYGPLQDFDKATVTPKQIFDCVCEVRRSKLPDPAIYGNAGSFFKNPIVNVVTYQQLARKFPSIVGYALDDGRVKLAAGWLIEHAGLKGFELGRAAVHKHQALVLINLGGASGAEVAALANHVVAKVYSLFAVTLEIEPRLIANQGVIAAL
ncbi:UDP-N-acetylmuramate dehydrogenase [Shewanella sp. SNU WT4]|uniref:UDP-N-acetylmuramate dehydrogenase n=1 Tax=Shewanella sp. SNU WT4 TaxID=2590015 RepID=UPI00143D8076|nr:UDP-N-acetylmuramate dehydrogenase [Shewanella sp. SNU WT4]